MEKSTANTKGTDRELMGELDMKHKGNSQGTQWEIERKQRELIGKSTGNIE